jgi:hypothetical protein
MEGVAHKCLAVYEGGDEGRWRRTCMAWELTQSRKDMITEEEAVDCSQEYINVCPI